MICKILCVWILDFVVGVHMIHHTLKAPCRGWAMLLIWDVTSSAGAKDYYAACLAPGTAPDRQGYFSEGQESPGLYGGKLGEELGLAGKPVDQETVDRLCDNINPATGKKLTPRTNDCRRGCKDFTFSGPKPFAVV